MAVAEELLRRDPQARVLFAGSERDVERKLLERHGYEHTPLPSVPSSAWRRNPVRFAWNNWSAFRAAGALLQRERPRAVIGLGGFASAPVVAAASRIGIPVVLLEQNYVPGRATRWLANRAALVCVSFPETVSRISRSSGVVVAGNPVRRAIAALADEPRSIDRPDSRRTLLVLGGSQGSRAVNGAVLALLRQSGEALRDWNVIHQTGAADFESVRAEYRTLGWSARVEPFLDDIVECYRRADLTIARAGGTTLAELACAGCPAVLVPYPGAIGDHQTWNARAYEAAGAARIVAQHAHPTATAAALAAAVASIIHAEGPPAAMREAMRRMARPAAAGAVVDAIDRCLAKEFAA